jgi:putative alpha-1,2-mannosidase
VNRSDLTEKYSRQILKTQYGNDGAGLPGNDDYGTMSAWLIFASLGFYPLPSTNLYALGSPVIHSARIKRRNRNGTIIPFEIDVENNSYKNYLTKSIKIDGKSIKNTVNYEDLKV